MKTLGKLILVGLFAFYLGIYQGHIAILDNGQPEWIFPYSAELLPLADQKILDEGIVFTTKEELSKLLQDYLS